MRPSAIRISSDARGCVQEDTRWAEVPRSRTSGLLVCEAQHHTYIYTHINININICINICIYIYVYMSGIMVWADTHTNKCFRRLSYFSPCCIVHTFYLHWPEVLKYWFSHLESTASSVPFVYVTIPLRIRTPLTHFPQQRFFAFSTASRRYYNEWQFVIEWPKATEDRPFALGHIYIYIYINVHLSMRLGLPTRRLTHLRRLRLRPSRTYGQLYVYIYNIYI